jgi:hypothetical protein
MKRNLILNFGTRAYPTLPSGREPPAVERFSGERLRSRCAFRHFCLDVATEIWLLWWDSSGSFGGAIYVVWPDQKDQREGREPGRRNACFSSTFRGGNGTSNKHKGLRLAKRENAGFWAVGIAAVEAVWDRYLQQQNNYTLVTIRGKKVILREELSWHNPAKGSQTNV